MALSAEYWIISGCTKTHWELGITGSDLVGKRVRWVFYALVNMEGEAGPRAGWQNGLAGRIDVSEGHIRHGIDKYHTMHSASQYLLVTAFSDITRSWNAWHKELSC